MDVYSDLWPTALEAIGDRIAATLFSGDGSKVVAVIRDDAPSEATSPRTYGIRSSANWIVYERSPRLTLRVSGIVAR